MGELYLVKKKDGGQFYTPAENIEAYAAIGYEIYRIKEEKVTNIEKEVSEYSN